MRRCRGDDLLLSASSFLLHPSVLRKAFLISLLLIKGTLLRNDDIGDLDYITADVYYSMRKRRRFLYKKVLIHELVPQIH